MSYCVNCGVELDESAKKCALCSTPVINLNKQSAENEQIQPPYPDRIVIPKGVRRRYTAALITIIMVIPNIICTIANLLVPSSGVWSLYVSASSALVWVLFIVPFMMKKIRVYLMWAFDTFAAVAYTYVFYSTLRGHGWFLRLALPLILVVSAMALLMLVWLRRKQREKLNIIVMLLALVSLFSLTADGLIHYFYTETVTFTVSIIIAASCAALMGFFFFATRNTRFHAWLSRKFFV
ncbi:MAG: zinc ribbon domain-containing protein [Clostridiales bacterium]|nr:zinc ribbon domain-containing protein [Clostridiales bacterium]